mmetsp:Transcript_14457/g.36299  ORF Transcript_14457/g.36299 Transcript_14457/m.36299 type:complete len:104 (-) Transcript_14457:223-534(-)
MLLKERVKSSCAAVDGGCCVENCDENEEEDDEDDDCNGDDCCNIGNDRRNGFLFRVDIFVVASSLFVVRDGINGSAKSQFAQITQSKRIVRGSEHFHIVGLPS